MQQELIITLPVVILFGILFWIMIFLNTYRHFPNMKEKIKTSVINATVLTYILIVIIYIMLIFFPRGFLG